VEGAYRSSAPPRVPSGKPKQKLDFIIDKCVLIQLKSVSAFCGNLIPGSEVVMADKKKEDKASYSQHPLVDQLRPDPSIPPAPVAQLEGLPGNSDREGWGRLYFSRSLTYYAEFRKEDIVFTETVSTEQSPLAGLEVTRVGIRRDAVIEYTRTTRAKPSDEFDLDIQLAPGPPTQRQPLNETNTCGTCNENTCITCQTCPLVTCHTCQTACEQGTCHTCQTCNTCQTCATACHATCQGTCLSCVCTR
jgi:hypothetical protein